MPAMDTSTRTYESRMTETRTQEVLRSSSRIIAWMVVGSGVLNLIGWAFDISALKSVIPGQVAMNPATAVCFILLGLALYLGHIPYQARARLGRQWCGIVVILVAG